MTTAPHARSAEDVLQELGVRADTGLSRHEAARRRRRHGPNLLRRRPGRSMLRILGDQLTGLIVWLLAAAMALSFLVGEGAEALAIAVVLVINTAIGFFTEMQAVRSVEALRRIVRVGAKVRRDGQVRVVPASDLVPGDVVLLEGGDVVAADLRLLDVAGLECDESTLTGESVAVPKRVAPLPATAPLHERTNMVFKGTAVTRGVAEGVAVATGMATELGQISSLVQQAEAAVSPLEQRLTRLGGQLAWLTLALAALIVGVGLLTGKDALLMVQMGIALAVAAVPEGLPIVATVVLARGMWRMAHRNALVENLPAVETLGATTVIFTDKTGTLTENRMALARLVLHPGVFDVGTPAGPGTPPFTRAGTPVSPADDPVLRRALEVAVLCNDASLPPGAATPDGGVGDPMEVALLVAAARAGLSRASLLQTFPEVREEAFDPELKMMATIHAAAGGRPLVAVKGAPAAVLDRATSVLTASGVEPLGAAARDRWRAESERLGSEGLRVLALATKTTERIDGDPYAALTLLGLAGILDPPRADAGVAVAECRRAGVRVVMVTGDQAATALAVARAVGLTDGDGTVVEGRALGDRLLDAPAATRARLLATDVFARVSPRQKLDLIALYQVAGEVVAMTGDGVNDAPALKKADIGIAMGRGTDVAREAADMVLRDDALRTIVAAIEQGRVIFANLRTFVVYLLSCNLSEVLVVGLAALSGLPLPILPLQILYLNLITDVFPAFALGLGEGAADVMAQPPRRPGTPVVTREGWLSIAVYGVAIMSATLLAFGLALTWLELDYGGAVSVAFLTLAFAQLWHVFNMRRAPSPPWRNEVTGNPLVWAALAICTGLILGAVWVPALADVLRVLDPGPEGWMLVAGFSVLPLVGGQVVKVALSRPRP